MKHLTLLLLVTVAACESGYGDDYYGDDVVPPPPEGNGALSASWSIVDQGAAAMCPAGATTAMISSLRAGTDTPFVDLWDCASGSGSVSDLPAGSYAFTVSLTDDTGATVYAESQTVHLLIRDGETTDAGFVIDGFNGFWNLSWTLATSAGEPVACADTAQNGVSVLSTTAGTTDATDSIWNCEDGEAPVILTTDPVAIGGYVVQLSLLDATDSAIAQSETMEVAIDRGNQFVSLGVVPITQF
jgi:hypothetical protein